MTNPKQTLKDIQKVNLRVDTLINEIRYNIEKTNEEINQRKKRKDRNRGQY